MNNVRGQITDILDQLGSFLDDHDSTAMIVEVKGTKVVIQLTGQCAECDSNCVEDAIREKLPIVDLEFLQY